MTTYRVVRDETVTYTKDFTRDELIELGVPESALPEGDLISVDAFNTALDNDVDAHAALTEATERHGDVQGNTWSIRRINEEEA